MCGDRKAKCEIASPLSEREENLHSVLPNSFSYFSPKKGTTNDDVVLSQEKEGANSCSNFELTASKLLTT